MNTIQYQSSLITILRGHFDQVIPGWTPFKGSGRLKYSPRVDIAIGPINDETKDSEEMISLYNDLLSEGTRHHTFLKKCHETHVSNLRSFLGKEYLQNAHASWEEAQEANKNSRCLIAIEIENKNSVKHKMGSMVNAASLGRFGIGIGCSDGAMKTFLRHIQYFTYLKSKEKGSYETANLVVLTPEQMTSALLVYLQQVKSKQPSERQ